MSYFISLLKRSFWTAFSDKKSLLQMLIVPIIPMILIMLIGWVWYLLFTLSWFNPLELGLGVQIFGLICAVVLFVWFIALSVICSYLGSRSVYNTFINTYESYSILFSQYRWAWKYFTTSVAMTLYVLGWMILMALSLFLWFVHEYLFVWAIIFIMWGYIYVLISQSFTYSFFFFEWETGFSAVTRSKNLVHKFWWKTFGLFVGGIILIALFVLSLLALLIGAEYGLQQLGFVFSPDSLALNWWLQWVQTLIQTLIGIWGMIFTFSLFSDYQKNDSAKNTVQKVTEKISNKKTVTPKKTTKAKK